MLRKAVFQNWIMIMNVVSYKVHSNFILIGNIFLIVYKSRLSSGLIVSDIYCK